MMQVEDMVLDYFGIISQQIENSNQALTKDMQFQIDKLTHKSKVAREITKPVDTSELTVEKAKELGQRIQMFTMNLMQELSKPDPATGKTTFDPKNASQKGFDISLQKEKDKFYMETGYNTDAVTKVIKQG